ncbi:MAG: TolC family protein [Candidatus Eisenbacteria bacterium]|nr:TolC family protein [Candidatus Eisenbacteria bacterium]MCC7141390.1 TolC family protein [Candidatus Eisenbacteria bacterium]
MRKPGRAILTSALTAVLLTHGDGASGSEPVRFEQPVLSLAEAVRLGRLHSPMILAANAGADAARAAARGARAQRYPTIEARETFLRTDSPADVFGLKLSQEIFSLAEFSSANPNDPEPFDHWSTEIEASLPVWTGGKLSNGIRQADQMAKAAGNQAGFATAAVELSIAQAYLDAVLAAEGVTLAESAYRTTSSHVEQAQAYFDSGMMVESDLLQAKVQLAQMEDQRISSRSRARIARAGLVRAAGIEVAEETRLEAGTEGPAIERYDLSLGIEAAVRDRRDLAAGAAQLDAARAGVGRAIGGFFPDLGVRARYTMSDDTPFGAAGSSYLIAAQASWKFWDSGKSLADLARSRHESEAASRQLEGAVAAARFEVTAALLEAEAQEARRATAEQAVAAAERAHLILEDRWKAGAARTSDLLDAETALHAARVRALEAKFNQQRAARALLFAIGQSPVPEVKP